MEKENSEYKIALVRFKIDLVSHPTHGVGAWVNTMNTCEAIDFMLKNKYMCFDQRGDISTLNSSSLKLVDKFTYLGSSV